MRSLAIRVIKLAERSKKGVFHPHKAGRKKNQGRSYNGFESFSLVGLHKDHTGMREGAPADPTESETNPHEFYLSAQTGLKSNWRKLGSVTNKWKTLRLSQTLAGIHSSAGAQVPAPF